MSNTVIGVIIAVLVVGGGAYAVTQISKKDTGGEEVKKQGEAQQEVPQSFTGTIEGLLGLGNVRCTFAHTDAENAVEGTIYVAGERLRGDFTASQGEGEAFNGSMIRKNDMVYVWGDTPYGTFATQMTVSEQELQETQQQSAVDLNQEINYDCQAWSVDESKFAVPSDIEFQDMQQFQQPSGDMKEMQCRSCGNIADPNAQAQCKAALGCS